MSRDPDDHPPLLLSLIILVLVLVTGLVTFACLGLLVRWLVEGWL